MRRWWPSATGWRRDGHVVVVPRTVVDAQAIIILAVIFLAMLGIWLLPKRKRWNDDGAADEARRQAVERDLVAEEDE